MDVKPTFLSAAAREMRSYIQRCNSPLRISSVDAASRIDRREASALDGITVDCIPLLASSPNRERINSFCGMGSLRHHASISPPQTDLVIWSSSSTCIHACFSCASSLSVLARAVSNAKIYARVISSRSGTTTRSTPPGLSTRKHSWRKKAPCARLKCSSTCE